MRQLTYDSINIGGKFVEPDSIERLIHRSAVAEEEVGLIPSALSTYVGRAAGAACDAFASDEDGPRHR